MAAALEDILSNWDRLVFIINRQVLLVHRLLVQWTKSELSDYLFCLLILLFVGLVAGAVGLLDFELEQFSSSSQMKLSDQWA